MLLNYGLGEDSWESLELQGNQTSQSLRKSVLNIHWKDWCWSSGTLATWCEQLIHWKRPWCWERLRAGREVDNRGWDSWMASSTQWTTRWTWWTWVGGRQGGLACYSPWGCKESDMTEWLNWINWGIFGDERGQMGTQVPKHLLLSRTPTPGEIIKQS